MSPLQRCLFFSNCLVLFTCTDDCFNLLCERLCEKLSCIVLTTCAPHGPELSNERGGGPAPPPFDSTLRRGEFGSDLSRSKQPAAAANQQSSSSSSNCNSQAAAAATSSSNQQQQQQHAAAATSSSSRKQQKKAAAAATGSSKQQQPGVWETSLMARDAVSLFQSSVQKFLKHDGVLRKAKSQAAKVC